MCEIMDLEQAMAPFWEGLSLMPCPNNPLIHIFPSFSIRLQGLLSRLTYACGELSLPSLWISGKSFSNLNCAVLHCERFSIPFSWEQWAELICMTFYGLGRGQAGMTQSLFDFQNVFPRGYG